MRPAAAVAASDPGIMYSASLSFGYTDLELEEAKFIRSVSYEDLFASTELHGFVGFGLPETYGNYEKTFMRMVQEEQDLSYPTLYISFLNKSRPALPDFTAILGTGDQSMPEKKATVPIVGSERIQIEVSAITLYELPPTSTEWVKYKWSTVENSNSSADYVFQLETTDQFSRLTPNNFAKFTNQMKSRQEVWKKLASICGTLDAGEVVLNSSHLCQKFEYTERRHLPNKSLETVLANNIHVSYTVGGKDFGMGFLFLISNKGEKIEYEVQENDFNIKSLLIQFAFQPGKANVLGMNALQRKILFVDYYGASISLGECINGETECALHTGAYYGVSYRAFKIALDILVFIFFVSLIFAGVVSYDKFANEEEYVKE